jgi:hypothetical protein
MSTGELATTAPGGQRRVTPTLVSDTLAIAWRGVITYRRVPQLLVFSTIQPVVFVLLFSPRAYLKSLRVFLHRTGYWP